MTEINWKKLQNGSDIRGVAMEGIKNEDVDLTPAVAKRLGECFAVWLKLKYKDEKTVRISVGMDSRLSGPALLKAVTEGLTECGIEVYSFGLASTPAMFMSTVMGNNPMHGAIMLTASHLPFNRNGLKFFTRDGGLDKADITAILNLAESDDSFKTTKGSFSEMNFMDVYASHFVDMVRSQVNSSENYNQPLKGLKIVVDAGNGAGGFYATKVLEPLGADISASQYLEPDGRFPNHVPNPEDATAMSSIVRAVKESQANLGVIFDTDVDRMALVAGNGSPINRNALIALISAVVLDEHPGTTIVTDSITSNGLAWFIKEHLKGRHHRYKRGYKNVINEAIQLNHEGEPTWLAIETSGHAALKENYFLDDGAYLATKLIITLAKLRPQGKNLAYLIKDLPAPIESNEFRIPIKTPDFKEYGQQVIMDLGLLAGSKQGWDIAPDNFEGVRINSTLPNQKGWFLLRLSLHDPVIPLNIESEVEGGMNEIAQSLYQFFKKYDKLDLSAFKALEIQ